MSLGAIVGILVLGWAVSLANGEKVAVARPDAASLAGQLLVATPAMNDPRFAHTVIYMIHHDPNSAMGLVVNRSFKEVPIALLMEHLGMDNTGVAGKIRMHYGGPVEPGRALILHTTDYATKGTQAIGGGIAVTGHPDILRALGAGKGPRRALLALGYAGWAPGQLESEIRAGVWVTVSADPALLFGDNYDEKWERAMARRKTDL